MLEILLLETETFFFKDKRFPLLIAGVLPGVGKFVFIFIFSADYGVILSTIYF